MNNSKYNSIYNIKLNDVILLSLKNYNTGIYICTHIYTYNTQLNIPDIEYSLKNLQNFTDTILVTTQQLQSHGYTVTNLDQYTSSNDYEEFLI